MRKEIMLLAILVLATLVACSQQSQLPATGGVAQTPTDAGSAGSTGSAAPAGNVVEINMTAKDFKFSPNAITVHKGDHVIIHIVNSDEDHGLAIQGYDNHIEFGSGPQDTKLEFDADKAGTFTFFCDVPCGSGHRNMKGTLVVE